MHFQYQERKVGLVDYAIGSGLEVERSWGGIGLVLEIGVLFFLISWMFFLDTKYTKKARSFTKETENFTEC